MQLISSDLIKFTFCLRTLPLFRDNKPSPGIHIQQRSNIDTLLTTHLLTSQDCAVGAKARWPGDGLSHHDKETWHLPVCCCPRRYSCWRSCSACRRTQRAGTGSSSPAGPAAAGTHATLAECYKNKWINQNKKSAHALSFPGTAHRLRKALWKNWLWSQGNCNTQNVTREIRRPGLVSVLLVWLSQTKLTQSTSVNFVRKSHQSKWN